jgi:hypothetical protein
MLSKISWRQILQQLCGVSVRVHNSDCRAAGQQPPLVNSLGLQHAGGKGQAGSFGIPDDALLCPQGDVLVNASGRGDTHHLLSDVKRVTRPIQ